MRNWSRKGFGLHCSEVYGVAGRCLRRGMVDGKVGIDACLLDAKLSTCHFCCYTWIEFELAFLRLVSVLYELGLICNYG